MNIPTSPMERTWMTAQEFLAEQEHHRLEKQALEAARGGAAPASALNFQNSNNGIEHFCRLPRDEFRAKEEKQEVEKILKEVPSRLRKKMFALRLKIEWMVQTHGIGHVGMQTLTIRENITDRREFERRFKSISTNVFPEIFLDWLRVFERQQRGCWHAHVVVATKDDIRTGTDVVALNQLLKDKRDRKICKAVYYSGIKRLASPNLKAIWKEFRRLCGVGEFKARRQKKGARYYKFDACHLLPIISTAQALAVYVSKYISKGFEFRRPEDKGMRLVGSTRRVSRVCNEHFSWLNGGGYLHRRKLGILAGYFHFTSLDDFADKFGPKWAYHLGPVIQKIMLPEYNSVRLAIMDGVVCEEEVRLGLPPEWQPAPELVSRLNLQAYAEAKEILFRRSSRHDDVKRFQPMHHSPRPEPAMSGFRSWIENTSMDN